VPKDGVGASSPQHGEGGRPFEPGRSRKGSPRAAGARAPTSSGAAHRLPLALPSPSNDKWCVGGLRPPTFLAELRPSPVQLRSDALVAWRKLVEQVGEHRSIIASGSRGRHAGKPRYRAYGRDTTVRPRACRYRKGCSGGIEALQAPPEVRLSSDEKDNLFKRGPSWARWIMIALAATPGTLAFMFIESLLEISYWSALPVIGYLILGLIAAKKSGWIDKWARKNYKGIPRSSANTSTAPNIARGSRARMAPTAK
jgi:hypothetical protein